MLHMLTVEEALASILSNVRQGPTESIPLGDCLYRVSVDDLTTPHDSPPFDKSMMDGFAVQAAGFRGQGGNTLGVLETITAGTVPSKVVTATSSSRIMTGAPIPEGANCVVPIERVDFNENEPESVTISADDVAPERHVLRQGRLAKSGEPLLFAGAVVHPQHIAVLAEFGVAQLKVSRRPTVAVLATGDELLSIDQPLTPGKIRNSNEPMLVSQIQRTHATAIPLGVARDNRDDLRQHIERGLACDFLLLSGGVSAGTLDLVPSELTAAGVEGIFHKIQMKPGKPLWFGTQTTADHQCCVFGLPGNPVSSMICFEIFVRTALRTFCGQKNPQPKTVRATLTADAAVRGDRLTYFPATLFLDDDGMAATPVLWGGSADLRSTAQANGMIILEPKAEPYAAGDIVPASLWE